MKGKGCKLRIDDTYEHTLNKQGLGGLNKQKGGKRKREDILVPQKNRNGVNETR